MECDFSAVLWVDFVAAMRVMAYQGNEHRYLICEWYHWQSHVQTRKALL
jgi:hypothetical protein